MFSEKNNNLARTVIIWIVEEIFHELSCKPGVCLGALWAALVCKPWEPFWKTFHQLIENSIPSIKISDLLPLSVNGLPKADTKRTQFFILMNGHLKKWKCKTDRRVIGTIGGWIKWNGWPISNRCFYEIDKRLFSRGKNQSVKRIAFQNVD